MSSYYEIEFSPDFIGAEEALNSLSIIVDTIGILVEQGKLSNCFLEVEEVFFCINGPNTPIDSLTESNVLSAKLHIKGEPGFVCSTFSVKNGFAQFLTVTDVTLYSSDKVLEYLCTTDTKEGVEEAHFIMLHEPMFIAPQVLDDGLTIYFRINSAFSMENASGWKITKITGNIH